MTWDLITVPDEFDRCCVLTRGERCSQPTAWRVTGADRALDEYAYVCGDHVELVRRPGDVVEPVARGAEDLERFDYQDGIVVLARDRAAADRMHARIVAARAAG